MLLGLVLGPPRKELCGAIRLQSFFIHVPNKEKGTKALAMMKAKGNIPAEVYCLFDYLLMPSFAMMDLYLSTSFFFR
jgi:hypothetical protein